MLVAHEGKKPNVFSVEIQIITWRNDLMDDRFREHRIIFEYMFLIDILTTRRASTLHRAMR